MLEILKYKTLTKVPSTSKDDWYTSAIAAIEGVFTSARHASLVDEYIQVAKQVDDVYVAVGSEPPYSKFETAYLGYLTVLFIEQAKEDPDLLESDVLRTLDLKKEASSLALASLLGLDVFIVDSSRQLLATNAVEGTDNPCCLVINNERGYQLIPSADKLPLFSNTDKQVSGYERLPAPDFKALILEDYPDWSEMIDTLFSSNKRLLTSVLDRLAYVDSELLEDPDHPEKKQSFDKIRLLSLANTLVNTSSKECTLADLQACGIYGDADKLINYVNLLMKKLRN